MIKLPIILLISTTLFFKNSVQNIEEYLKGFKRKASDIEMIIFIPIDYPCEDCNQKIFSFFEKEKGNHKIVFIFVSNGKKLMNFYFKNKLRLKIEDLENAKNVILDYKNTAKYTNLISTFPTVYKKSNKFNKVELNSSNIDKYL